MTHSEIERALLEMRPAHRKDFNDIEWARHQSQGAPAFFVGDIVELHEGRVWIITDISYPHDGWPSSYALASLERPPKRTKAWVFEGDFKRLVAPSPARSFVLNTP